jgi:hypothetical protein
MKREGKLFVSHIDCLAMFIDVSHDGYLYYVQ